MSLETHAGLIVTATSRNPAVTNQLAGLRKTARHYNPILYDSPEPVRSVSIPFWVFCVLRPAPPTPAVDSESCFNPVLGFLCSATVRRGRPGARGHGFNPVLGFLCSATGPSPESHVRVVVFQSRSGFSVFCDCTLCPLQPTQTLCFNPVLGFLCSATGGRIPKPSSLVRFNPVLGFLCSATIAHSVDSVAAMFQSRSGFSVFCDPVTTPQLEYSDTVSIPFWVFCVLRLQADQRLLQSGFHVSIPFWVFCVLRPVRRRRGGRTRGRFNPVLGFLCSATG